MRQYFEIYYSFDIIWHTSSDGIKYAIFPVTKAEFLPDTHCIYRFDKLSIHINNQESTIKCRAGYAKDYINWISVYDPVIMFLHLNPNQFKIESQK